MVSSEITPETPRPDRTSILYIINSLEVGGTEKHLVTVLSRLDRARWAPSIFTLFRPGALAGEIGDQDIPIYCARTPSFLEGTRSYAKFAHITTIYVQLVWHLIRNKPQIVHYFLPASYLIGMCATYTAHALTFFTGRLPARIMSRRSLNLYQRRRLIGGRIERLLHSSCSAVLGNSEAVITDLKSERVPPEILHLIYNGVELPHVQTEGRRTVRESLDLPQDAVVATMVANFAPYKGHADLLKAFAKARREAPVPFLLCLVGRDDGRVRELEAEAERLGIGEYVRWLGERFDIQDILGVSDIGVLSSHEEGFSNAILESMAAGLPMVATSVGGNPEAVVDGATGLIVAPRDTDALAEALVRLVSDPSLREQFGNAALQRAQTHFSMERCVNEYEQLYDAIVDKERQRSQQFA